MKILRLRFKNLNSLAGEWEIDFTHPDYVSSGIFAITGPTGAGKTTVLDAICLALYGQTPRLSKITQSENELMSRQTGECSAEAEFETAKGRFRCHWSQHRSRKQAEGPLQVPKHEICDAETGTILESKLKAVAIRVEDVTGMDFDRFTRSMLLAQGGFAAFLQARPDERAPILEQITGTEIYSRISMQVHERTSDERRKLAEMRAELDGIRLLAPEEEESVRCELAERKRSEAAITAEAGVVRECQAWLERIAELESELLLLDQAWISLETRKKEAESELVRLANAGRAVLLEGEYAHLAAVRKQQEEEMAELASTRDRLPLTAEACSSAVAAREAAESALYKARCEQAEEAELIRAARELDVKLQEMQSGILEVQTGMDRCRQQLGELGVVIARCDDRLYKAGDAKQEIELFRAEHEADGGLIEAFTGLEQQVKTFKAVDRQCAVHRENVSRQAAMIETAKEMLSRAETAWRRSEETLRQNRDRLAAAHAAREVILKGRELSAWRDEVESLASRHNRLANLLESAPRFEKNEQKLAELGARLEFLAQRREELARLQERVTAEYALREEVARQLHDKVMLLNRVRSLEEERKHLADGAPCPLCGSTDHPYAAGNVPSPDKAQLELEMAVIESKKAGEQLSRTTVQLGGVDKELEQAERERLEMYEQLANDKAHCRKVLEEVGLDADAATWAEMVRIEAVSCRDLVASGREVIREAERNEQEERGARSTLDKAAEELAANEKARVAAQHRYETALNELDRLERESTSLHDGFDRAMADVERAVEPYGHKEITPENVDAVLASLIERRGYFVRQMQAKENLEKELTLLQGEKDKQQALLTEAERGLAEKELDLDRRVALRDGLTGRRRELYGNRDPDREEKRLADALHAAGERRDHAVNGQNRLEAELAALNGQIEKMSVSTAAGEKRIAGVESALRLRLTEAGFEDEASFLQARLPRELYGELTLWAESLRRDETEIVARKKDRKGRLQSEQEKCLTDKTLEDIRYMNEAVTLQLSELQRELGALGQKLQHHAEQQQLHSVRLQEIDVQKQECARWERLHVLIGSSDGKKFRNFAQGLTFELMVVHANRQLQKMSDRYILVRDAAEPLELNVIDNYQAGEVRSTKNLSGGESFIASLALSLGLSGMASRNVRVDSLFLDEGFGTLDEDALETALETLSGLQQEGKLIGIISHVPALKERIGTQIQVEAGSAGRSSLSGPGCRSL